MSLKMAVALLMSLAGVSLFSSLAWAQSPDTVNVYVPRPRGGFGDIASNILMIQNLRHERPSWKINAIIDPSSEDAMKTLWPGYESHVPGLNLDGIHFYSIADHLPRARVLLSFSNKEFIPEKALHSAKYSLNFYEYGEQRWSSPKDLARSQTSVVHVNTGAGAYGFYISSKKKAPPLSRNEVISFLEAHAARTSPHNLPMSAARPKLIAFSYTNGFAPTLVYKDMIADLATHEYTSSDIYLICKEFERFDFSDLPSNVHLVYYKNVPLNVSEAMIAYADFPVMVTGDGSLTAAIQFEKPFFYEMNAWKRNSADEIARELLESSPILQSKSRYETALAMITRIAPENPMIGPVQLASLTRDKTFMQALTDAVAILKSKANLTDNVIRFLRIFETRDVTRLTSEELSSLVQSADESITAEPRAPQVVGSSCQKALTF